MTVVFYSLTDLSKIVYLENIAKISNILIDKLQYSITFSLDTEIQMICLILCMLKLNMRYKSISALFLTSDIL